MAGATQVTITLTLAGVSTFENPSFPSTFRLNNVIVANPIFQTTSTTTAVATVKIAIAPGPNTFRIDFSSSNVGPIMQPNPGTFTLSFNDVPPTTTGQINLTIAAGIISGSTTATIACIHGSSLIVTLNGLKRIDQLTVDDQVLSGCNLNEFVKIKSVAQCWIQHPGPNHDAVIFEPHSLDENNPYQRLIIDPGHPMCSRKEFLESGIAALRPAGSYLQKGNERIYVMKWTNPIIQEDPSVRYDLILEDPYCTYIANGVVVRSAGYESHSYKNLI